MRSFNKNEIRKILAKAAELEMTTSLNRGSDGLTEQEILELAKESGISTSSIKVALFLYNDSVNTHNEVDELKIDTIELSSQKIKIKS
jgi:hypothetical protein